MIKADILDRAINGLSLDGADVARVSRYKRSVTLRHSWKNGDGRAQNAVLGVMREYAQVVANEAEFVVDLYTSNGDCFDHIWPDVEVTP